MYTIIYYITYSERLPPHELAHFLSSHLGVSRRARARLMRALSSDPFNAVSVGSLLSFVPSRTTLRRSLSLLPVPPSHPRCCRRSGHMRFVFPYEYNTSEPDTATASRRPAHPVSGCGGDHHHHHHHQQYRRSQYENRRMTGKKCVQLRTSSSSSCANNSVVTCAVTSNPATNTTMALSIGSKLPLQSADKNRHRPRRKRGWLYRTFIGDDTQVSYRLLIFI